MNKPYIGNTENKKLKKYSSILLLFPNHQPDEHGGFFPEERIRYEESAIQRSAWLKLEDKDRKF